MSSAVASSRVAAGAARRSSPSPGPRPVAGSVREKVVAAADKDATMRRRLYQQHPPSSGARPGVPSMLLRRAGSGGGPRSLNVSCASEASNDSFCSRASTGRIGRPVGPPGVGAAHARRRAAGSAGPTAGRPVARKAASVAPDVAASLIAVANGEAAPALTGSPRCPWVTPNTDPCYAAFHDHEWGVPVHDDKKLFEMLVLSGALAEMTWPAILSKRETFREVFMDFDPLLVAKLSERKILGPCSPARSLLSEHRLRIIIENAQEVLKVIEEFGSFDNYCWGFLNSKPMVGRFRHPREVPMKTPKADAMSQDLLRRGFLGVGPTVIYAFMQAVGMANDHLVTCYRFSECCTCSSNTEAPAAAAMDGTDSHSKSMVKDQEVNMICGLVECVSLEPSRARATTVLSIS
uniref:DNA-3-methyladenine glycosylase I n=1 Tax=Oryza punctata TaxID=4537 RepID=A0A0E0M1B5_ORYPU